MSELAARRTVKEDNSRRHDGGGYEPNLFWTQDSVFPDFSRFAEHWWSLPRTGLIPHRRDFRPECLGPLMAHLVIHELISRDDIRLRLVGTGVAADHRREIQGSNYLDFAAPARRHLVSDAIHLLCDFPCGVVTGLNSYTSSGRVLYRKTLGLPVRDDTGAARLVYYCSRPSPERDRFEDTSDPIEAIRVTDRYFVDIGAGIPEFDDREDIPG